MRAAPVLLLLGGCLGLPARPADRGDGGTGTDTPLDGPPCTFGPWFAPQSIPSLETTDQEFDAALDPAATQLVFVRNQTATGNRVYVSQVAIVGPTFTAPTQIFGALDGSNLGWRSDGGLLYITVSGSAHEAAVHHAGPPPTFDSPMATSDLDSLGTFSRPSFTADGLDVYVSKDAGVSQIVHAHRGSASDPWPAPTPVDELNAPGSNSDTPAIRADGLEMIFATDRGGGNSHLYEAHRAKRSDPFSAPMPITELGDGIRPTLSRSGTLLVFDMYTTNNFDLFYATRTCQ